MDLASHLAECRHRMCHDCLKSLSFPSSYCEDHLAWEEDEGGKREEEKQGDERREV